MFTDISGREDHCVLMNPEAFTLALHRNGSSLPVNISSALTPVSLALSLPTLPTCKVPSLRVAAPLYAPLCYVKPSTLDLKGPLPQT